MRLDVYMCSVGLSESRKKAQDMIRSGVVYCSGKQITKPAFETDGNDVEIIGDTLRFVGRGGLKLEGAIKAFGVDVKDLRCADIGSSTGGFTDCLLQYGASEVYAIDSGRDQLHCKLKSDPRVVSIEGFNAKTLTEQTTGGKVDMVVMDVSFISQIMLYPAVCRVLKPDGMFISLIKPQFEAGKAYVGKNGIVKDEKARKRAVEEVISAAAAFGLELCEVRESNIKGGDGNIEYTALFRFHPRVNI